jgi:hypothetical protein
MALRIGALILASCQLLSGSVISFEKNSFSLLPAFKPPLALKTREEKDSHDRHE